MPRKKSPPPDIPPPGSLDEPLLIRFFAWFGDEAQSAEDSRKDLEVLQRFVAERPNLTLEVIDLSAHPEIYHHHYLQGKTIRVYRNDRQVDCPALRDSLRGHGHLFVDGRPTDWFREKNGFRKRDLPRPIEEMEYTELYQLQLDLMFTSYSEFADADGEVYGPFSSGVCTTIFNLATDCKYRRSRPVGETEWRSGWGSDDTRPPAGFVEPEIAQMRREMERFLRKLAADLFAEEIPATPPVPWDYLKPEEAGFRYRGFQYFDDPLAGVRLSYHSTCPTRASIYFYPMVSAPASDRELQEMWLEQMDSELAGVRNLGVNGMYQDFQWLEWPSAGCELMEEMNATFLNQAFQRSEVPTEGPSWEKRTLIEFLSLAPVAAFWLKVRYTTPNYLFAMEINRFARFALLAREAAISLA